MNSQANRYIREVLHHTETPPPVQARFFYTSPLAIDDPLSPLPPLATTAAAASKQPPRPFSDYDNTALDKAWHELRRKVLEYYEQRGEKPGERVQKRSLRDGKELQRTHESNRSEERSGKRQSLDLRPDTPTPQDNRRYASSSSRKHRQDNSLADISVGGSRTGRSTDASTRHAETPTNFVRALDATAMPADAGVASTTGTPFIRSPSRREIPTRSQASVKHTARPELQALDSYDWKDVEDTAVQEEQAQQRRLTKATTGPSAEVPVGVSRLHHVTMPHLQMEPIYWTPVNDIASVVRATWFYKDTMLPIETPVANMLEAGYVELRPWTETWQDELKSAAEVGAAGEMKVLHMLWPERVKQPESRPGTSRGSMTAAVAPVIADTEADAPGKELERAVEAACDIIDISSGPGGHDNKAAGTSSYGRYGPTRTYPASGVIYASPTEAYILKPNLQPSLYYGRRPYASYIKKGRKLGVAVVRGFDQAAWDRLYPPKKSATLTKAQEGVSSSQSGAPPNRRQKLDADLAKSKRPNVTDLVLVVHGIGQKLSERMESFHFTHAINAFRREVNVELGVDAVKAGLRKDAGGIMVLPVNWRHSLSFEEGGYRDGPEDPQLNKYSLKDITPETLPSVRNIVSDVMLDIPYYLSHHQPKMIAAVIREANRVYQLWCMNNPGFAESGNVHLIAHSLGSVMAVDILSKQPTHMPPHLSDPTTADLDALEHFLFDTGCLFLAGSPAGLFLLLKRASLLPRLDRCKPGSDPASNTALVCGEEGTYGCLAVDNVYNLINPYDPVAYRINATVDATYAAALKQAWVPPASPGWFSGYANPNSNWTASSAVGLRKPPMPRLPSNVELEIHDFTREEIAEKRMYLLNDNGQVDWFLRYGGAAWEIQYLTMLGAHSSYWVLKDFVRFVVGEVGREKGRKGARLGLGAVKRKVQLS
ncbi:hypothetical protein LTR66_001371 [Elasticomyces elasticus]|nr:hypothetical protein LTR66_001371 [Elasticomyces elasticus]